ncbi:MAG: DUF1684 domain-containing protein [Acidimicrobiia bacterium]|jgi:uncharacterized protein (DUF1684 family)|nr:DUF1684 domain-containing protein [Acidimicrobiia bacterium]MDQ3537296.1 DUF1684 domain-containing protein [Actinomycetota bacterium]
MIDAMSLLDYRRRVSTLYTEVRQQFDRDAAGANAHWRAVRDQLFAHHPQSALPADQRGDFSGLHYYDYDPQWALRAPVDTDVEPRRHEMETSTGERMALVRVGRVALPDGTLDVYWIHDYGGGLFIPFRDATGGDTTYGGGRYLFDTAKGADLGSTPLAELVCDFNFAYHPSCHYDPAYSCPLAPPGNRLDVRVEAGEQSYGWEGGTA